MDNVMNRPLFRRRDARDRLNEMAGVQGYQDGGPVEQAGIPSIMDQIRASGITTQPMTMAAGLSVGLADRFRQRPEGPLSAREQEAQQTGETMRTALDYGAGALSAAGSGLYGMAADVLSPAFATLGATSIAAELERQSDIAYNVAISNLTNGLSATEGMSAADFDMEPAQFDFVVAKAESDVRNGRVKPAGPRAGLRTPGDVQGPMAFSPPKPRTGPQTPGDVQGPMAFSPPAKPAAATEAAPTTPAVAPTGPSGMEMEARGRGPLITNPAEVAAGLNAPDPAVREKTAADFMQEYMANAPKYEGMDKKLMHAMIGFSIAAGDSPNAMTNIAKGLQAGAQMFLQDKAAKDEFDRQIQLSSMKYGLEAAASERERGSKPLTFVALEDTVYKGRPVKKNQSVVIPYSEIERNGGMAPPGFGDTSMVTAMVENEKGFYEALEKARVERQVDDTFAESQRAKFSEATSKALSAQRGLEYMEAGLLTIADGEVTGLKGSANQVAKNLAAAAGLDDVAEQFDSRDEALGFVTKGFQNLIPVALSGTQTGNSISNFDVENLAKAYVDAMFKDGIFSMAFVTDEKLMDSLKSAMNLLESGRQQALTDMTSIERTLLGRTLRSGVEATTVIDPYRSMVPLEESVGTPSYFGSLYRAEDGIYDVMNLGG